MAKTHSIICLPVSALIDQTKGGGGGEKVKHIIAIYFLQTYL